MTPSNGGAGLNRRNLSRNTRQS